MSGNGWCTHPDRQVSSDVRILVRKAELACRNAWGSDLWEAANAEEAPAAQQPTPPQPTYPSMPNAVVYDDEVTSVMSSDEHKAHRSNLDDEVVEQSIIRFDDDDYDHEQDERRDLLYRDSRSAIQRARQRHMNRNTPQVPNSTSDDDDVVLPTNQDEAEDVDALREKPSFEPDDFVEEEAPTSPPVDEHDDTLISEGIQNPSPRSRRLRRFRDARNAPKTMMTAKTEPETDEVDLELPPSAAPERGRFDSIPEISAEMDIPLLRRRSSAPEEDAEEPGPDMDVAAVSKPAAPSTDRALKRAHDMHYATRIQGNRQRREDVTPAMTNETSIAGMPDLPEPQPERTLDSEHSAKVVIPSGTSAVLHPRPAGTRQEDEAARRPRFQTSRPRLDEPLVPQPEARQSWWRGTRKTIAEHAYEVEEPAGTTLVEDELESCFSDHTDLQPTASSQANFDLNTDEDLESFRSRLFASAPTEEDRTARDASQGRRSPISMARRERPAVAPAAPQKRRRQREDDDTPAPVMEKRPETSRAEPRRRMPIEQPERQERDVPIRLNEARVQHRDEWYEPEEIEHFDVRSMIDDDDEGLLDMTIEIAPEVPRACVTCRNYRPSEQPGRGWCTNTWAFTHRQMVNETDIACDSTIGCWWLPADEEVWLDEFEIAAEATPRIDRLVARAHPERKAASS